MSIATASLPPRSSCTAAPTSRKTPTATVSATSPRSVWAGTWASSGNRFGTCFRTRACVDGDGLTDSEEQDLRATQCACDARGPKSLLGSGSLLREPGPLMFELGARPCSTDDDCIALGGTSCIDAVHCDSLGGCPPCSTDVTLNRTDPRTRDSDSDGIIDFTEVFGYLTGAGIVDPSGNGVIVAGSDLKADTLACEQNHCVEDSTQHCMTDGDCFSRNCLHPTECDEVQVVEPGAGVRDVRTVVVAPGPLGGLTTPADPDDGDSGPGNSIAESRLQGDDQLVVGPGQSVIAGSECADLGNFMLCSSIKPGPNGRVDSLRAGDDLIIPGGTGQKLEVSDPLNPDTDQDLIADGNERLLGSSPNLPGDAVFGGDLDADGLTDVLEALGWSVQVIAASNDVQTRMVSSNPNLADTDFDGLPDFAERNMPCTLVPQCTANVCSNDDSMACATDNDCDDVCPTDPRSVDTDDDGITDYNELSVDQFAALTRFNDFFPGYVIDGSSSSQYGTDPTRVDTDSDGLSDRSELFVGWTVVRDDGTVAEVFSDPTKRDTDADGLPDDEELAARTDPGDPDTDADGRLDGLEVEIGTNPLQRDIFVAVTYSLMQLDGPGDGDDQLNDWAWRLSVQDSDLRFPGATLSTHRSDCPITHDYPCGHKQTCLAPAACMTARFNFFLNRSAAFTLTPNKGILLNGLVVEITDVNNDTEPVDVVPVDKCRMAFIDQPLTYNTLQSGTFMTRTFQLADPAGSADCGGLVVAEISVNCIGEGKGFCRIGNPCVANEDCESDSCSACATGTCQGVGRCESVCGNGIREFAPETLDGVEFAVCLANAIVGGSSLNCEACDDGNASDCGTCNATCGTLGAEGPKTCPVGTSCIDDQDCIGSCDPGIAVCVAVCGDGVVETGEVCDDGNDQNCGTCDANCNTLDALGPKTCTVGTGCVGDQDCTGTCDPGTETCVALCGNGILESPETCDDGNVDDCGTCDSNCETLNAQGPNTCPQGTPCIDDQDCAESCDPVTKLCTSCGNGITEAGEFCDDGNALNCGPCNSTCTGPGTGFLSCPLGAGCNANNVCFQPNCENGTCQPCPGGICPP